MNIPSSILIEAINYAKSNEKTKKWFERRDISPKVSVRSVKSEILKVSIPRKMILIRIAVDYTEQSQDIGMIEDIIIDLTWELPNKYKIVKVRAVPGL